MHPGAILSSTNYSRVRCGHRGNPDYHGRENESLRARQHTDADQAEDEEPTRRQQEHDCAESSALFEPSYYVKTDDLPRQARDKRKKKKGVGFRTANEELHPPAEAVSKRPQHHTSKCPCTNRPEPEPACALLTESKRTCQTR